jgi:hypothetical protein
MTPRHALKLARLTVGTVAATIRVIAADPRLAFHLGYVIRHTGPCLGKCSPACSDCMNRRLAAVQGYQPTPRQQQLLLMAAAPVRDALRRP